MNNLRKYAFIIIAGLLIISLYVFFLRGSGTDTLSQKGLSYYSEKYEITENTKAVVQNYGCHREIHIYEDNQLIMRLGYVFGRVYEI